MDGAHSLYPSRRPSQLPCCLLLTAVLLLATGAWAQANLGSIAGNILDPTGALVAHAQVNAKEVSSGTSYQTVSSSAGAYRLPSLKVGTYDVTVSAPGFKTAELHGVVVQVGTTAALDVTLQTGQVSETVEVQGNAPRIQTESVDIGTVVTTKQVLDLPLALGSVVQAMRSPEAFVFLTPGAVGPGTDSGAGGTFESKISGGQTYGTEVLLDGVTTSRSENGSSFDETAPSVDALGEFKVFTSTLPPEMGRTTGGVESFNTKSGTNAYHGVAYDFFRNDDLDANTWFNNLKQAQATDPVTRAQFARPKDKQNDYGVTMGGPVRIPHLYNGKDKTFFFFSWEQYRQNQGGVSNETIPTLAERSGDFSSLLNKSQVLGTNPCDSTPIYAGQIFDPATTQVVGGQLCRTAFPNNVIPKSSWSTVGQNMLSYYPTPQNSNLILNYAFPFSFPILDTSTTIRIDQNVTSKSKAYFTYNSRENARLSTNPIFDNVAGAGRAQDFTTHYIRVGYDYTVTPSMLNHFTVGYNRTNSKNIGAGVRFGGNWADKLGITGTAAQGSGNIPFPSIGFVGGPEGQPYQGIGDSVINLTVDNGLHVIDTLEWIRGKHDFKFGGEIAHQQYSPLTFSGTSGNYNFSRGQTAGTIGTSSQSGDAFASMLLGQPDNANLNAYANQARWLSSDWNLFFQDAFKVTPHLTLTYGLRWEVDEPRRASDGNTSNISLTTPNPGAGGLPGALVFAGVGAGRNGNVNETWANTWYKDFGPRVGFAWSPAFLKDKTVIRGGYGIIYGFLQYADFGAFQRTGFQANPAFSLNDGYSPAFNLDAGFPAFAPPPNLDPTQLNFQGPQYLAPSFGRPPMVQNWSLEVQHELATDLILDVAYVGQHSTHLRSNFDYQNSLTPQSLSLGPLLTSPISSPQAAAAGINPPYAGFPGNFTVAQALVPFPQYFGFNTDGTLENYGQSSYNALDASLQRRFHNGLNLLASYTWSKTLTDADSALPFFATLHGGGAAQNPFNKAAEKAISNQDIPQTLVLSYIYELPVGKGKRFLSRSGWTDKVFGGWSVSGVQRYQSGQPLSFCCATGIPSFAGAIRFDRVQGQPLYSPQFQGGNFNVLTDPMFNSAAFTDPNSAAALAARGSYAFGNMPRTTGEVRMFSYSSEDFNLLKRIHFTESKNLLIQVSMLDAFNRHVFNRPPDLNPNDPAFGVIDPNNTILGPRKVQLELRFEY